MKGSIWIIVLLLVGCNSSNSNKEANYGKIGTYKELKKELENEKQIYSKPIASISELEREVNNGGFNQYFFNSSGQNCFETLELLELMKKTNTASLLRTAIDLINPDNLPEEELIQKIRNREIELLDDDEVNHKLDSLDQLFYQYLDGDL